jgi:Ser/Thr protein kinase RdoA (MazF antagonist)
MRFRQVHLLDNLFSIARQFTHRGEVIDVRELGKGNINHTFLVTVDTGEHSRFILQRVNTRVFRNPELIMRNMLLSTRHMLNRTRNTSLTEGRRWEVPAVILTQQGLDHCLAPDGSFWRAVSLIEDSQSFAAIKDDNHAQEVGYAVGLFHTLLSDLSADSLADTLEGFHVTPRYLHHYDEVQPKFVAASSPEMNYCLRVVREQRDSAQVLEDARAKGRLFLRPIHGDPKVDNILIDTATGLAVSLVDLDTIKPGLVHYDIGDCLRSGCNPLGEDSEGWETVRFEPDLCRAIMQGYLPMAKEFLTENDFDYIYDSIHLIAFELGLRFFTDYLEGDVYFRIRYPEHNLARALVQFRLTESIRSQETAIRNIIRDAR